MVLRKRAITFATIGSAALPPRAAGSPQRVEHVTVGIGIKRRQRFA